jgi:hypothetical protein
MWMKMKIFQRRFETTTRCNRFKELKKFLGMKIRAPKWPTTIEQ